MIRAWLILVALGMVGCVSQAQFLDNLQDPVLEMAMNRGRFELNCPVAIGFVLWKVVQPALQRFVVGDIQRAEYAVAVTGCDRKAAYVVVCPEEGDGCFAAQSRNS